MHTSYTAQYLEELDFLHEVCLTALFSNRLVKFTSIVDYNGKLIIGEYRKGIQNYCITDFISDDDNHRHDSSYLFHLNYMVPTIKKIRFCSPNPTIKKQQQQEEIHFEIIEIDNKAKLAVAPLNETNDKYLCVYVESSAPSQEIISKLRNAII
jgi:hypothetical protein